MVMEATPSPDIVGREFVRQYYTLLNEAPEHAHRFYNSNSYFVHGSMTKPAIGQRQIHQKIQQLNFRDCHAKISQVDSQNTLGNGVVVQVSGELSNDGEPMRRFTQTFVLGTQSPKKYYVHNDIFRYQDMLLSEDEESAGPAVTPAVTAPESVVKETASEESSFTTTDLYQPPPPPQPLQQPPATSPVALENPQQLTAPPPPTLNGAGIHHHFPTGPVGVYAPAQQPPPQPTNVLVGVNGAGMVEIGLGNEGEEEVGDGEEVKADGLEEGVGGSPSTGKLIAEPTTYASFLKSPTTDHPHGPAAIQQSRPSNATHFPTNPLPAPSGFRQRHATTPTPPVTPAVNATTNVPVNASIGGGNGGSGTRLSGSRGEVSPGGGEERKGRGGGPGISASYPDNQQLFLGKIPQAVSEEELKEVLEKFGRIVDLRIHSGAGSNGKPGSGARPVANFGFVTFENAQSVQDALNSRPIMINDVQLNVQVKRRKQEVGGGGSAGWNRGGGGGNRPPGPRSTTRGGGIAAPSRGGPPYGGGGRGGGGLSPTGSGPPPSQQQQTSRNSFTRR